MAVLQIHKGLEEHDSALSETDALHYTGTNIHSLYLHGNINGYGEFHPLYTNCACMYVCIHARVHVHMPHVQKNGWMHALMKVCIHPKSHSWK